MFRYVIQQLLAKLIFLVVLHKRPARFVPALAPSTRLWRELEHLPLSGTQVKLCLLWDEPHLCWSREQSFPAPGDIAAPLETPRQEQNSPCLPKKNLPWQKEERRHGHRCAPGSRCLPPAARMVPAVLTPSFARLLPASAPAAGSCSFPRPPNCIPVPFQTQTNPGIAAVPGDAALCPKSGCWLFAMFSTLLIFSVKEKQSPCRKGREVSSGARFVPRKNEAVISLPLLLSAFNLVSTGRLKIWGGTRREGAHQRVPGTVLLPRFLQNQ